MKILIEAGEDFEEPNELDEEDDLLANQNEHQ